MTNQPIPQNAVNIFDFLPAEKRAVAPVKQARREPAQLPVISGNGADFVRYNQPTNPITGQEYKGAQAALMASLGSCNQFAGFKQWLSVGRVVKKGQHGIKIMMPIEGKDGDKTRFMGRTVFAIEQTEIITDQGGAA